MPDLLVGILIAVCSIVMLRALWAMFVRWLDRADPDA